MRSIYRHEVHLIAGLGVEMEYAMSQELETARYDSRETKNQFDLR